MKNWRSQYPDISDILARKASWRRQLAALSFAEKLVILDSLEERVQPIIHARKVRRERRTQPYDLSRVKGLLILVNQ